MEQRWTPICDNVGQIILVVLIIFLKKNCLFSEVGKER